MITRHRDECPVRLMCRVLEVTPSGFYASRKRPTSWHAVMDDVLLAQVRIAFATSGDTYGAPRIQKDLMAESLATRTKRVARLMRDDGVVARPRKAFRVQTTDAHHADPIAPNLLAQQFDVHGVHLNHVWVSDITYLPTREGLLYLATVLDLASRRCVGWAMRDSLESEITVRAVEMAILARRPAAGLSVHSDRGSQYAAHAFRDVLLQHGMVQSMSGTGNCYDNAVAESFFSTLEFELVMRQDWHTREDAKRAVFQYIETRYNRKRRHSTLGYVSPMEYELQMQHAA